MDEPGAPSLTSWVNHHDHRSESSRDISVTWYLQGQHRELTWSQRILKAEVRHHCNVLTAGPHQQTALLVSIDNNEFMAAPMLTRVPPPPHLLLWLLVGMEKEMSVAHLCPHMSTSNCDCLRAQPSLEPRLPAWTSLPLTLFLVGPAPRTVGLRSASFVFQVSGPWLWGVAQW